MALCSGKAAAVALVCLVLVAVLLAFIFTADQRAVPWTVRVAVEQGALQGEWLPLLDTGRRYASFKGVPYAKPPLGQLRFKAPRPADSWDGVRSATAPGPVCLQQDKASGQLVGSEDCLYLNVFVPEVPRGEALPVYFYVHGGGFVSGSGSDPELGPEFLLMQDIVVITINYRLSAFGLLSLDSEEIPGNAALKDQAAALRWVHRNVASFGGDPDAVTVGGHSAGAAGAHLLALLPDTRALVRRVILQSLSALHAEIYHEDHEAVALALAARLAGRPGLGPLAAARLLMQCNATDIAAAALGLVNESANTLSLRYTFVFSPERRPAGGEPRALTEAVETLVLRATDSPREMLTGLTDREWLLPFYRYGYAHDPALVLHTVAHPDAFVPADVIPYADTARYLGLSQSYNWSDAVHEVRSAYFESGTSEACNETCSLKQLVDDATIGAATARLVALRSPVGAARATRTFAYRFRVRADYSTSPAVDPEQAAGAAAVHGDELRYLWRSPSLQQRLDGEGLAAATLRSLTAVWGSFVRTGTPSMNDGAAAAWPPNEERASRQEGAAVFLDIGRELAVKTESLAGNKVPFWLRLYRKYRGNKSS